LTKDLNIRHETLKQLQEVVGNALESIGIGNKFLSRTQNSQHRKERMNKWDCIKLKSPAQQKKQSIDKRDCPQNERKYFAGIHLVRD
jgi:hypothetical protein